MKLSWECVLCSKSSTRIVGNPLWAWTSVFTHHCKCSLTSIQLEPLLLDLLHSSLWLSCLSEIIDLEIIWSLQARPLLEERNIGTLVDPRLEGKYDVNELKSMMLAAALCIRHSAHRRPHMSRVHFSTLHVHILLNYEINCPLFWMV